MQKRDIFEIQTAPLYGKYLIEASAGTGKTYTIANIYIKLLLERKLKVNEILVVTFTNAATEELKSRIRTKIATTLKLFSTEYLSEEELKEYDDFLVLYKNASTLDKIKKIKTHLQQSLLNFDEAAIYTIHGFCQKILIDNAFESGELFNCEILADDREIERECIQDFYRKFLYNFDANFSPFIYDEILAQIPLLTRSINKQYCFAINPEIENRDLQKIGKGISSKYDKVQNEFSKLQNNWFKSKEFLIQTLLAFQEEKGFKYGFAKKETLTEAIEQLDQLLHRATIPKTKSNQQKDPLYLFSVHGLNTKTRKGATPLTLPFFQDLEEFYSQLKEIEQKIADYLNVIYLEFIDYLKKSTKEKKENLAVRSYDDLLHNSYEAVIGQYSESVIKKIQTVYKAALIDEFQDTDDLQYQIFSKVFDPSANKNILLYLIGDPKQAIYRFRGADIFSYLHAQKDVDQIFTLGTNWRSNENLIMAINTLYQQNLNPFLYQEITYKAVDAGKKDQNIFYQHDQKEAPLSIVKISCDGDIKDNTLNDIVEKIKLLLAPNSTYKIDGQKINPEDIAVLFRGNSDIKKMQEILRKNGIPAVIYKADSVYLSDECQELYYIFAAIADPNNEMKIKTSLATKMFGYNAEELVNLEKDESCWDEILIEFMEYNQLWRDKKFTEMFSYFVERRKVKERLISYYDGERRITNLDQLMELCNSSVLEGNHSIEKFMNWLTRQLGNAENTEEAELRLETDENAVKLVTIHKCKGLQYPVVFCPFIDFTLNSKNKKFSLLHDENNGNSQTLFLDALDEEYSKMKENEDLAENLRLQYVALTRAETKCYFYVVTKNDIKGNTKYYKKNYPTNYFLCNIKNFDYNNESLKYKDAILPQYDDVLANLVIQSQNNIKVIEMKDVKQTSRLNLEEDHEFSLLQPDEVLPQKRSWSFSSYSALVHGAHPNKTTVVQTKSESKDLNKKVMLPQGSRFGNFVHEIFEEIDFKDISEKNTLLEKMILEKIEKYGFTTEILPLVKEMILTTLKADLNGQNLFLKDVELKNRISEMEFFLFEEKFSAQFIRNVLKNYDSPFANDLNKLSFDLENGFLRGFVDLVFQSNDKIYVVDWKTNNLGTEPENYEQQSLQQAMSDNGYYLQYYIYTLALYRFLKQKKSDFNYEKNFGGVFYIFTRGTKFGEQRGIFFDLPKIEIIEKLNETFKDGE